MTPSPLNPLGAKGAGEGGAVGTLPAVANAVADALGGHRLDPPYGADRVWRALQEASRSPSPTRGRAGRPGAPVAPRPRPDIAFPPAAGRPAWRAPALGLLAGLVAAVALRRRGRRGRRR